MARPSIAERDRAHRQAASWLALASCAVAVSGVFAILIALARVPALGTLFPGPKFYQVALVLHVNLSQGVWFMAFAGVLWCLASPRTPDHWDRLSWWASALGATAMTLSGSVGAPEPLMSNYVPVLDSPVFLFGLCLFAAGIAVSAVRGLSCAPAGFDSAGNVQAFALRIAAAQVLLMLALIAAAGWYLTDKFEGHPYFELLFWGGGHVWQFALASLMMFCWIELAPGAARNLCPRRLMLLVAAGAVPALVAAAVPVLHAPDTAAHARAYTWLMQWASWEAPLLLGIILLMRRDATASPGIGLSLLLFTAGLLLGALIDGHTTLVTAHYHGTIGAVTLAFMAVSFVLLPRLGVAPPSPRSVRLQLGLYGYGVLLMMAGLAGAGLMGAPRKTPGDLGVTWSMETFSRVFLGVGGSLATIGILMFAFLLIRRLFPLPAAKVYSR